MLYKYNNLSIVFPNIKTIRCTRAVCLGFFKEHRDISNNNKTVQLVSYNAINLHTDPGKISRISVFWGLQEMARRKMV